MTKDLITVVIPNYNGLKYLPDCLDSIYAGTLIPRVVVVDNASKDGSIEWIQERYPMVTLLRLGVNTGFCHAVNAGLHLTRTPYAMLLNNDTRVEPDCIEKLFLAIEKSRRLFSVQALMVSMQDPDRIDDAGDLYSALGWGFARAKGKLRRTAQTGSDRPVHIFSACAGAALYRMDVFDEIGWFDERHYCYLEDIDIGWRAQIAGYGNRLVPDAVVYHAGSATTGSRYNAFKETMTAGNNAYLLYKNMPLLQYGVNAPLWLLGRAVKKRYFAGMGLGEAYETGLTRGEYLKARAGEVRAYERAGIPWKRGSLSEEACVEVPTVVPKDAAAPSDKACGTDAQDRDCCMKEQDPGSDGEMTLNDLIPLYLGGKVPFRLSALPRYLSIEGQLIAGCLRRLWN